MVEPSLQPHTALYMYPHFCCVAFVCAYVLIFNALRAACFHLSHYSVIKIASGGPKRESPSGATPGRAEKGTTGPSEPGSRASPNPNENKTGKVQ